VRACQAALLAGAKWSVSIDKKSRTSIEPVVKTLRIALSEYHAHRTEMIKPFWHIFDPTAAQDPDSRFVRTPH
jgi:hypothetical protein